MPGYPQLTLPDEVIGYLDLIVPPDPQSASEVRQHAGYVFRAWGLRPEETGTAQLLAGELLANAITFTAHLVTGDPWEAGAISLSVRYHPGAVVIEVRDTDPAPPVLAEAGPDAESGRGLMLVAALSKEWGHYPLPSGGKAVYCVISTEHVAAVTRSACAWAQGQTARTPNYFDQELMTHAVTFTPHRPPRPPGAAGRDPGR